ncbi:MULTISPECIES: XRE family transcriptional regulator [Flavobacterium]|uniref:XRE family transcriptional regulator n=1 Tax=Flavobacterium aurantiibacter TaxID=2023067 RepID=A0A255ZV55_9FLAO|nr:MULTISPECIES: LexA family transcriptional regulator [Flavobacterium]OYQ44795.1 XRE family transcriptional regulator [Flavobacterium aurantiibacter]
MTLFGDNIRHLRIKKNLSQDKVAQALFITRGRYAKYEEGKAEPPYDVLRRIAALYNISIDLLLALDVKKVDIESLIKLDDNKIVLPITVDSFGRNSIELVSHRARAGYLSGYSDPEYIESLPQISIPFLGPGKYRAFPISGDSMPPHNDNTYVIGRYIDNLGEIRKGKTYIVVTANEGITYKRLADKEDDSITVASDNVIYAPYKIKLSEIIQIWEFGCSITTKEAIPDDLSNVNLKEVLLDLRKDIKQLKKS